LKALDDIIEQRMAKCKELEEKIDKLDDDLFEQYLELEFFEEKKRNKIQTRLDV
jgi:hypothetical protein|tara:strand:+ start:1791 stop:1952 length:162 start_codon:yes stop_codon:yes gene_type:complete